MAVSEKEQNAFGPFVVNQPHIGLFEKLKMIFLGPFAPIRFIIAVLAIFTMTPAFRLISGSKHPIRKDLSPLRRLLLDVYAAGLFRFCILCGGAYHIDVRGKRIRMINGKHVSVVANHQSWLDICVLVSQRCFGMIAKQAVTKIPVIGPNAPVVGTVFVDRESKESRMSAIDAINDALTDPTSGGVTVFPEGTTTNGHCIMPFKTTIFRSAAPVQPVVIRYPNTRFNVSLASGDWKPNFFRCLTQFVNHIQVTYLPPTEREKDETPEHFAERVRALMADELGVPMVDYAARNKIPYREYLKGKISLDEAISRCV